MGLTVALMLTSLVTGALGSMLGSGAGLLLVPALVLFFHLPVQSAAATSLVCVVAGSLAAQVGYLRGGYSRVELGLLLGLASVAGALIGSAVALQLPERALQTLLAVILVAGALAILRAQMVSAGGGGRYRPAGALALLRTHHLPAATLGSGLIGVVSGMLGIGGGPLNVPLLYLVVHVPLKVALATSNFMVGLTATGAALIYLGHGVFEPHHLAPCLLGTLVGSQIGSRLALVAPGGTLRAAFVGLLLLAAAQMALRAAGVSLGR